MSKIRQNRKGIQTAYISTIIGIVMVLFIVGVVSWFGLGLNHVKNAKVESYEIEIFFNESVNDLELGLIETEVANKEYTSGAFSRTSDEALKILTEDVDPDIDLTVIDGENPIDQHIIMTLKKEYFTLEDMEEIEKELMTEYQGQIKEVSYDPEIFEDYNVNLKKLIYFVLLIAFMLLFIAIGMINNTIRLALFSKRFLIKTMQLVGATPKFIRRPFMLQAIGQGVISGLIAGTMVFGLIAILEKTNPVFLEMTDMTIFLIVMAGIVVFGVLITMLSTFLALRKYLRMNLDNLY
ncbi:MAG: FtsX-like permease family protein [Crocinitomicaceae bacterium]|nr:FtsX-like permease family protein [Crocinitomicaceae bacterium]